MSLPDREEREHADEEQGLGRDTGEGEGDSMLSGEGQSLCSSIDRTSLLRSVSIGPGSTEHIHGQTHT